MEKNNMILDKVIEKHIELSDGKHDMLLYKLLNN